MAFFPSKENIDAKIANYSDWSQPIDIVIKETALKVSHENRFAVITGRLRKGSLHGPVVMKGTFSNDPKSNCPTVLFDGLGFVGHFEDGIPKGICWKELRGGAWIYGRVDKQGQFSGDFNYFNNYLILMKSFIGIIENP